MISGYVVSRQALTTRIARAEMDKAKAAEDSTTLKDRDVLWDMNRGEGGVAGMEHLEDKYATTRWVTPALLQICRFLRFRHSSCNRGDH